MDLIDRLSEMTQELRDKGITKSDIAISGGGR